MSDLYIYLQFGWRNLWLNPARTSLTVIALALGISALTFLSAMNDGWVQQIKSNFSSMLIGHVQVHADGFEKNRSLAFSIENPGFLTDHLGSEPRVAGWTSRISVSGLATSTGASAGVRVLAVEPEREKSLSHVANFVRQGRWLTKVDDHAVLLGEGLADRLRVGLGNKVVLMAALPNGDIASEVFRVRGILFTGVVDIDNYAAIVPLSTGQRWLGFEEAVTDIVIFLHDFESVQLFTTLLREKFSSKDLEVLSWSDIDPMAEQWSQFADVSAWIILAIVIFVVMAEVLNTMLMSMHDRTRELGMMSALGVTHWQIFTMILWETLILVVIGSLLGFAMGSWVSAYFGEHGIDLSRYAVAFSFSYMDSVIYPDLSLASARNVLGAAVIGAFAAGLYPAWRATRLDPVIAMREI